MWAPAPSGSPRYPGAGCCFPKRPRERAYCEFRAGCRPPEHPHDLTTVPVGNRAPRFKSRTVKGVAIRTGPESCGDAREGGGEALTGEYAGRVLSREIRELPWKRRQFG